MPMMAGNGNGTNIARLAGQAGQQMEMNALLPPSSLVSTLQGTSSTPSRIHVPEISLHAIRFQQDLGEGAFGKVSFFFPDTSLTQFHAQFVFGLLSL